MTTDELITRARRAIETGQPNLAKLYMRKALEQTDQERQKLNPLKWKMRQLSAGFNALAGALSGAGQIFEQAIRAVIKFEAVEAKLAYTLAGPGK